MKVPMSRKKRGWNARPAGLGCSLRSKSDRLEADGISGSQSKESVSPPLYGSVARAAGTREARYDTGGRQLSYQV